MSWRRKEPGHQQQWYWPTQTEITRSPHVKLYHTPFISGNTQMHLHIVSFLNTALAKVFKILFPSWKGKNNMISCELCNKTIAELCTYFMGCSPVWLMCRTIQCFIASSFLRLPYSSYKGRHMQRNIPNLICLDFLAPALNKIYLHVL